jgi:mRNA-degrading endonuclease RelE of RelBE toxin-antitoxin system
MKKYRHISFGQEAIVAYTVLDPSIQQEIIAFCDKLENGLTVEQLEVESIRKDPSLFAVKIGDEFRLIFKLESDKSPTILIQGILNYYFYRQYYGK